jgi:hypothetical protein
MIEDERVIDKCWTIREAAKGLRYSESYIRNIVWRLKLGTRKGDRIILLEAADCRKLSQLLPNAPQFPWPDVDEDDQES